MNRRGLLKGAAGAGIIGAAARLDAQDMAASGLPPAGLLATDPEHYWSRLRAEHFALAPDFAYLHNGTLGVPPKSVIRAVERGLVQSAQVGFAPLNRWGAPIESVNARAFDRLRDRLAATFGCASHELTLTANTTQALALVADGLGLGPGDDVLVSSLEHRANIVCWARLAARSGVRLRTVDLPLDLPEPAAIAKAFAQAMTPRTRVVSFAAIVTSTGVQLPAREILAIAKAHGATTVVDAAHMPGQVPLDLAAMGCDYLAASPHKWLFAPAGCGFLYGRGDGLQSLAKRIQPGAEDEEPAQSLMQVGTSNGAVFDGFAAALDFYEALGPERIFARLGTLRALMMRGVRDTPGAVSYTPDDPARSAGMVAFHIPGVELRDFAGAFAAAGIRVAPGRGIRLSAHVHTRPEDIARFFAVLREQLRKAGKA